MRKESRCFHLIAGGVIYLFCFTLLPPSAVFALRPINTLESPPMERALRKEMTPTGASKGLEEAKVMPDDVREMVGKLWLFWDPGKSLADQSKQFQKAFRKLRQQGGRCLDLEIPSDPNRTGAFRGIDLRPRPGSNREFFVALNVFYLKSKIWGPRHLLENIFEHVPGGRALFLYIPEGEQWIVLDKGPGIPVQKRSGVPQLLKAVEGGVSLVKKGLGAGGWGFSNAVEWAAGGSVIASGGFELVIPPDQRTAFVNGTADPNSVRELEGPVSLAPGTMIYLRGKPLAGLEEFVDPAAIGFDAQGADSRDQQQANVMSVLEHLRTVDPALDPAAALVVNVGSGIYPLLRQGAWQNVTNWDTAVSYAQPAAQALGADYSPVDIVTVASAQQAHPAPPEQLPRVLLLYRMGVFVQLYNDPAEFFQSAWTLLPPGGWLLIANPPHPAMAVSAPHEVYAQLLAAISPAAPAQVRVVSPDGTLTGALAIAAQKPLGLEEDAQLRMSLADAFSLFWKLISAPLPESPSVFIRFRTGDLNRKRADFGDFYEGNFDEESLSLTSLGRPWLMADAETGRPVVFAGVGEAVRVPADQPVEIGSPNHFPCNVMIARGWNPELNRYELVQWHLERSGSTMTSEPLVPDLLFANAPTLFHGLEKIQIVLSPGVETAYPEVAQLQRQLNERLDGKVTSVTVMPRAPMVGVSTLVTPDGFSFFLAPYRIDSARSLTGREIADAAEVFRTWSWSDMEGTRTMEQLGLPAHAAQPPRASEQQTPPADTTGLEKGEPLLTRVRMEDLTKELDLWLAERADLVRPTEHYGEARVRFRVVDPRFPFHVVSAIAAEEWVAQNGELDQKLKKNGLWLRYIEMGRPLVQLYMGRYQFENGENALVIERVQLGADVLELEHWGEVNFLSETIEAVGEFCRNRPAPLQLYLMSPEGIRLARPEIRESIVDREYYDPVNRRKPRLWGDAAAKVRNSALGMPERPVRWFVYKGPSQAQAGAEEALRAMGALIDSSVQPVRAVTAAGQKVAMLIDSSMLGVPAEELNRITQRLIGLTAYPLVRWERLSPEAVTRYRAEGYQVVQLLPDRPEAVATPDAIYIQRPDAREPIPLSVLAPIVTEALARWQRAQGTVLSGPLRLDAALYLDIRGLTTDEIWQVMADRFA